MNLSELFSVYNEIVPETKETKKEDTKEDKKEEKISFYTPLDQIERVREVLKTDNTEEISEVPEIPKKVFSWGWSYDAPKSESIVVPYNRNVTPSAAMSSAKLEKYRTGENAKNYQNFKQELDKFIENNPQYASIKDNLDYLAALESEYKLGVENYQGSGALGWFQFMDNTRKAYNKQSREDFSKDAQAQLLAAAQHYTNLQNNIRARGGNHKDFVTMYGAWWRPESAYAYLKDDKYDFKTQYGESLSGIRQRAQNLLS